MSISTHHAILRAVLRWVPRAFKPHLYRFLSRICLRLGSYFWPHVLRLPFGLVLKVASFDHNGNEAAALAILETLQDVNTPHLIDHVATSGKSYILMTEIRGDCCATLWDDLTIDDKDRIAAELQVQLASLRSQTINRHMIGPIAGPYVSDPRIPWFDDEPRTLLSSKELFEQTWIALDIPELSSTLHPVIRPIIDRPGVPTVLCHGDIAPKNIILPGGLERWRRGTTPIYIIDWEYAGWMPAPWEALKATWTVTHLEDEWYRAMKIVFAENAEYFGCGLVVEI